MVKALTSTLRDKKTLLRLCGIISFALVAWVSNMFMSSSRTQERSVGASLNDVKEEHEHCGCGSSCSCNLNAKNNPCQCGPACGCRKGL